MKILLPLVACLFFLPSCLTTSYAPVMPNQPMPIDKGEIQFTGALGTDHAEAQFSNAICPNFATYAGGYRAYKGISQYEVGGMLYTALSKAKKAFFAAGGGYGQGKYKNYNADFGSTGIYVNSAFNSWHMQYALYLDVTEPNYPQTKIGFCFKSEHVHFLKYNMVENTNPDVGNTSSTLLLSGDGEQAIVNTFYFSVQTDLGNLGFYFFGQMGLRGVNGFTPDFSRSATVPQNLRTTVHPFINPVIINLSLGYRFNLYYRR
jgi:hypothetical protein